MSDLVHALFSVYTCADALGEDKKIATGVRQQIVALLGKWRFNLGAMKDVSEQQVRQEAAFLIENFPTLKLDELALLVNLSATGKLEANGLVYYGSFSPIYISQAVNAFEDYSQSLQAILVSKKPRLEQKASPTERAEAMRYMIAEVDRQIKAKKVYVFMINDVANYLRRTGKIVLSENLMTDAKSFADKKIEGLQKVKHREQFKSMRSVLEASYSADSAESLHMNFLNEYLVSLYFSKNDLKKVVAAVGEKDFQD